MWPILLICFFTALAGALAFWLVITFKVQILHLNIIGPLAMLFIQPYIAAGLVVGAWAAEAFVLKARESIPTPEEGLGWRRVMRDVWGIIMGFLVGVIYMFRRHDVDGAGLVLITGLALSFSLMLCYLYAISGQIPKQIRIKHGYVVGFIAFLPWALLLARFGWTLLGLAFFTFMLVPPFLLSASDMRLNVPVRRHQPRTRPAKHARVKKQRRPHAIRVKL